MDKSIKYYTPTIEEFHIGFEFENLMYDKDFMDGIGGNRYFPEVYNSDSYIYKNYSLEEINLCRVRVKYLDEEDIESLGFIFKENKDEFSKFIYKDIELHYRVFGLSIYYIDEDLNIFCVFNGIIKNKSELKKLLRQLNIM